MKLFAVLIITTVSNYTILSHISDLKQFFSFQNPYTFVGYHTGQCTEQGGWSLPENDEPQPATRLYFWCSYSHCPSAADSHTQGWRGGNSLHASGMISVTRSLKSDKSTAPLKKSNMLFQRIWAVSQDNGFLQGNIQRVVWSWEKSGQPWGKCLASADRRNKSSG